jgi:hypothetical protein
VKLGEKMTILDRTIQFTPNKFFIPIENMKQTAILPLDMVRTDSQQGEIGSKQQCAILWLRGLGSNQRPSG